MKTIFYLIMVIVLQGCNEEEASCDEYYIIDYEYITLEDGSVITGAPIYQCRLK